MVYVSSDYDQPNAKRYDLKESLPKQMTVHRDQENGIFVNSNIYVSFFSEEGVSLILTPSFKL
jgi:hypothetical protein